MRDVLFISGTDTNIGKTLVSALFVKLMGADYWKPVQCGDLEKSDSKTLRDWLGPSYQGTLHPERYALETPCSPHLAAKREGALIKLDDFALPKGNTPLVIEGAGGCLAPLNDHDAVLDIASQLGAPVILVTRFYLGAYNHTLLSIEAIQKRGIEIRGLVLNGGDDLEFREYISRKTKLEFLGIIPQLTHVDSHVLETLANQWRRNSHDRIARQRPEPRLASVHPA
jgi:dethiobiotin synthetase